MKIKTICLLAVLMLTMVGSASAAGTVVIDFEDLPDTYTYTDEITYPGVTISSAKDGMIIVKSDYYISGSYPPHSPETAIICKTDEGCKFDFDQPVTRVGLWYTSGLYDAYLEAYDSEGNMIDSVVGPNNYGYNGYMEVSGSNIDYVVFHDHGNYMVFDDLEYDCDGQDAPVDDPSIPEFPTVALPIMAILGLAFIFQRRNN